MSNPECTKCGAEWNLSVYSVDGGDEFFMCETCDAIITSHLKQIVEDWINDRYQI